MRSVPQSTERPRPRPARLRLRAGVVWDRLVVVGFPEQLGLRVGLPLRPNPSSLVAESCRDGRMDVTDTCESGN
jgi:hypothetical protein